MRTTPMKLAALLLCALAAGEALAQAKPAAATPAKPADQAKPPAPKSSGFLPPAASSAHVIDSVYVIVNDEVITKREVDQRVNEAVQNARTQKAALPDEDTLRRQVVEFMITERAQIQMAKDMGVRVDDTMVDRAIGRIAESQKMSVQDYRNAIEKEGMSFGQFREQIRNEILLQRLVEHEVDSKIQVTDAEIDTYLAAEKAAAADRVEMDISQILVGLPENPSPEQIAARKARADEVSRQLRTGASE
jgi:peptidyl-prolyl cis-trans isomerase SurA